MKNYLITLLLLLNFQLSNGQTVPKKSWMQYTSVTDAGYSQLSVEEIKKKHLEFGGGALLVVYDGAIVMSSGDITRKYMDHSMRKSYLSALYGIHSQTGEIDLNESIGKIEIDDQQQLSKEEKKATVRDLLMARSGVYHPSAYSPRGMAEKLPARGSHAPGSFWYYNNWDFNTLSTIFKQKTNLDLFEAFEQEIARPLGFEDFELEDTHYRYEEVSQHPAYLFRLSARDEARFGLLYLNKGNWRGKQIIPPSWIEKSTSPITTNLTNFENRAGYAGSFLVFGYDPGEHFSGKSGSGSGSATIYYRGVQLPGLDRPAAAGSGNRSHRRRRIHFER